VERTEPNQYLNTKQRMKKNLPAKCKTGSETESLRGLGKINLDARNKNQTRILAIAPDLRDRSTDGTIFSCAGNEITSSAQRATENID
jgi:hypothetical protein